MPKEKAMKLALAIFTFRENFCSLQSASDAKRLETHSRQIPFMYIQDDKLKSLKNGEKKKTILAG